MTLSSMGHDPGTHRFRQVEAATVFCVDLQPIGREPGVVRGDKPLVEEVLR